MGTPQNKKTRAEAPVKALDLAGETGRASEGERLKAKSGGLGVERLVRQEVFATLVLMAAVGRAARVADAALEEGVAMRLIAIADIGPIDIGAQVFATDEAASSALYVWTAISRNWPVTTKPLAGKRWMHAQGFCQGGATTKRGNRLFYGCYIFSHKANTSDAI